MSAAFSQFCTASQAGYNALRQCIDLCARQEHSYEFPGCLMPDGCVPEREALSVRSMTSVLEGVLTPVFAQAALNSRGAFRLTGLPGSLRLIPAYPATSSTVPVSVSSL